MNPDRMWRALQEAWADNARLRRSDKESRRLAREQRTRAELWRHRALQRAKKQQR